jgi:hypothetical protein
LRHPTEQSIEHRKHNGLAKFEVGLGENRYAYVGNNPVGHSLGGRAALAVARQLVEKCRFAPDYLFTIDPFEAPDVRPRSAKSSASKHPHVSR